MPLLPDRLFAHQFPVLEHSFSHRDTQLYALGVGMGHDPLDLEPLRFVYEGQDGRSLKVLPTMANILGYPGFWARESDAGISWQKIVHAEQEVRIHAALPPAGRVSAQTRITGLWDKGPAKGALLQQTRDISDATTGQRLATVVQLSLLRGDGGFGEGASASAAPEPHAMPLGAPDSVAVLPTSANLALIYRLSGDMNPLHADPAVATLAGFARPILHGMAVMGIAAHAVLRHVLNYDESRFSGMRVRFTAPVWPGDTLSTEMWVRGNVVSLRTTAVERNVVVLSHSCVTVR